MSKKELKLGAILLADPLWLIKDIATNGMITVEHPYNVFTSSKINTPTTTPDRFIAKRNKIDLRGKFFKVTKTTNEGTVTTRECDAQGSNVTRGLLLSFNQDDILRLPQIVYRPKYNNSSMSLLVNPHDPVPRKTYGSRRGLNLRPVVKPIKAKATVTKLTIA